MSMALVIFPLVILFSLLAHAKKKVFLVETEKDEYFTNNIGENTVGDKRIGEDYIWTQK